MKKDDKNVIYIYGTKENKDFLEELANKHNETISNLGNKIIEGFRTGKKVTFETVVPKFVKQAEAWKKKHVL